MAHYPNADLPGNKASLFDGIGAFFGGIGFILFTPGVWIYAAVPVGLVLLLTCTIGIGGFYGASAWSEYLLEGDDTWAGTGRWAVTIATGLVILVVGTVLGLLLAQPLSSPALESIVHAQQRAMHGPQLIDLSFGAALWLGLRVGLMTTFVGLSVSLLFFLISVFFPPALAVTTPLQFLVFGWLLAWDFLDYPLGMRGLGLRQRLRWIRSRAGAVTAFGLIWSVALLVPGIFLFVLPMGVAGAARLVVMDEVRSQSR